MPERAAGDIVVMDNLGSPKAPSVRAAIEAAAAPFPLLPPDFNPTALLRKSAKRIGEGSWAVNGRLVDAVMPHQRANLPAVARYEPDVTETLPRRARLRQEGLAFA